MTIFKSLYRRKNNFFKDVTEVPVPTTGLSRTWDFVNPGWVAFDYMCIVPDVNGELPNKWFEVYIDGVRRHRVRASWAWTREWLYVDAGKHVVEFKPLSYGAGDSAKVRRIELTNFEKCSEFAMIEAASVPRPMESITTFPIIQGSQRYQRTGTKGTVLEFTLIFETVEKWRLFMKTLENFYIIKGDYGMYGGTILPQDVEPIRKGPLVLMKCVMNSPHTAGVGVDGL